MTSRVTVRVVDGQEADRVSQTIVVIPPSADHDLGLLRATKDLELQALVPDSCSEMAVSLAGEREALALRRLHLDPAQLGDSVLCTEPLLQHPGLLGFRSSLSID
jgi:hypothetical protein